MATVHADAKRTGVALASGRSDQRQRGKAPDLGAPSEAQRACGRKPDPDAGKASRAKRDTDVFGAAPVRQIADHRNQPFGMATAKLDMARIDERVVLEEGNGTGLCGRFYRECSHGPRPASAGRGLQVRRSN